MTRIIIHGYGAFPIFYKYLIITANRKYPKIDWGIILPTYTHVASMYEVLSSDRILYLFEEGIFNKEEINLNILQDYPGNIFEDIETDKAQLKNKSSEKKIRFALSVYSAYKTFLQRVKPTHVLFGNIETVEGKILYNLCKELKIHIIIPCHARNLGESYFSGSLYEYLPFYATPDLVSLSKAKEFLLKFKEGHIDSEPVCLKTKENSNYDKEKKPFIKRFTRGLKQLYKEQGSYSLANINARIKNNMPLLRNLLFEHKKNVNSKIKDIYTLEDLPENYIFYPLQYSPESSINIPAPFFIDQERVIDLIRLNMPSNMYLVIKEHPSCITVRSTNFLKRLQKKAGVLIADYKLNTREIIKRSALTTSVTGTATFEAFLLGKPSLTFGATFFSEFIGGICSIDNIQSEIKNSIKKEINEGQVIEAIAKVYSISSNFILRSPGEKNTLTMTEENVNVFLEELIEHISKINKN